MLLKRLQIWFFVWTFSLERWLENTNADWWPVRCNGFSLQNSCRGRSEGLVGWFGSSLPLGCSRIGYMGWHKAAFNFWSILDIWWYLDIMVKWYWDSQKLKLHSYHELAALDAHHLAVFCQGWPSSPNRLPHSEPPATCSTRLVVGKSSCGFMQKSNTPKRQQTWVISGSRTKVWPMKPVVMTLENLWQLAAWSNLAGDLQQEKRGLDSAVKNWSLIYVLYIDLLHLTYSNLY